MTDINGIPEHIPESLREVFDRNEHPYLMWDGIEIIPLGMEEVLTPPSMKVIRTAAAAIKDSTALHLIGCGTSYFAGIAACYAFQSLAGISASAVQAFEYLAYPPPFSNTNTLIGISHTGTTPVIIDAVDRYRQLGGLTIGITDERDSFLAQSADLVISGNLGKEPALPKTRSYIATLLRLYLLAIESARLKGSLDPELEKNMSRSPNLAKMIIADSIIAAREISASFPPDQRVVIAAGGPNTATAMEGALKLIEAALIHGQAWEIEEAAHGTWASTDSGDWIIILAFDGPSSEKTKSIFKGLKEIQAKVWVITDNPDEFSEADFLTAIPKVLPEIFTPLFAVIPLYLFTYEMAISKGIHPDIMRLDDPRYLRARTLMRPVKKS